MAMLYPCFVFGKLEGGSVLGHEHCLPGDQVVVTGQPLRAWPALGLELST